MSVLQALWLGVLQGVTEFLPISSSGHLVLGKAILGIHTSGVAYNAVYIGLAISRDIPLITAEKTTTPWVSRLREHIEFVK